MPVIESTPEMAAAAYAVMSRNLETVRRRLGKPLTLADKLLMSHLDDADGQEMEPGRSYLLLKPDRVALQDVLGQTVMLQFMQTRRAKTAVPTTVHCDHLIQPGRRAASTCSSPRRRTARSTTFLRRPRPSSASASGVLAPASSTRSCSNSTPSQGP